MTILLISFSFFPAVVITLLVSRFAKSGEHRSKLAPSVAFVLGAAMVLAAIVVQKPLIPLLKHVGDAQVLFLAFIIAGVGEEFVKLGAMRLLLGKVLPSPRSAITLGMIVGCGFAAVENLICVFGIHANGGDALGVALSRSLTSLPAHVAFGAIMGFCLSRPNLTIFGRFGIALLIPAFLHGWFNAPQLWAIQAGIDADGRFALPMLAATWVLVALTMDVARRETDPEFTDEFDAETAGLIPVPVRAES